MMVKKIIINADDLGFSLGVNQAILKAHTYGFLSHASLMANTDYFNHAVEEIIPKSKNLRIGVHVNLTCAKALFLDNVLTENGSLNNNFVKLLFKRKSKKVLESIEKEIELQILRIKESGIDISHIDGHEHVHVIPSINKIVIRLAKKYGIKRVREINEGIFESMRYNAKTTTLSNFIKLLLLRFLSSFNQNSGKVGFYSMLNTCEITGDNLFDFLKNSKTYETVEVMLHPAISDLDSEEYYKTLDPRFVSFFQDQHRKSEFDLCFNTNFKEYEIAK